MLYMFPDIDLYQLYLFGVQLILHNIKTIDIYIFLPLVSNKFTDPNHFTCCLIILLWVGMQSFSKYYVL